MTPTSCGCTKWIFYLITTGEFPMIFFPYHAIIYRHNIFIKLENAGRLFCSQHVLTLKRVTDFVKSCMS